LSSDGTSVHFGPCSGEVGPDTEACGPLEADGVTVTPDSNCNGLNGDGDYLMTSSPCAPTAVSFGQQSVHLFATPEPGTEPIYSCASRCPVGATGTFSYYSLSPCVVGASQTILGYAAISPHPNYVAVKIAAAGCTAQGTYVTSYQISIPEFTFYALPSP
jgi:hypothetical protein